MTLAKTQRPNKFSTLFVILTEGEGVCYLASKSRLIKIADIRVRHPDHSDVEWYAPADNEPDPEHVFSRRFLQYAGAVITAISESHAVRHIYICADSHDTHRMLRHIPVAMRARCKIAWGEGRAQMRTRSAGRIHRMLIQGHIEHVQSPFSS